jgi:hypothetical protein
MDELKKLSALAALNNMLEKDYFDICTIDQVSRLLDVNPKGQAYTLLAPLHCVHYDKMPAQLREAIPVLIQQCLGVAPIFKFKTIEQKAINVERIFVDDLEPEAKPERRGLMRLLGRG